VDKLHRFEHWATRFGRLGGWITVRRPPALAPLMKRARALWDSTHHRWCIVPSRTGPLVLDQLERFHRAGIRLH
jgi:hypothetical protein